MWRHETRGEVWTWVMDGPSLTNQVFSGGVVDTSYRTAALGDYDGDTKTDVVWHNAIAGSAWVWLMNGGTPASVTRVGTVENTACQIVTPR